MKFIRKLQALFRREKVDAEMAEEMRHHVELQTEQNVAAGMNVEEARFAALRQFGNVAVIQEQAREGRGWVWLEQLGQDLRYAVRQLVKARGFTTVVVLTLALGIGATTAIYSVVDTLIFNPVPGTAPDRVVEIGEYVYLGRETTPTRAGISPHVLEAVLPTPELFAELAWADVNVGSFERKIDGFTSSVSGCAVSPNFFSLFAARPLLGRTFGTDEAVPRNVDTGLPDRDAVIVLSYGGWQSLFGGDREVIGQTVDFSGRRFTVVGVMPAWFQFPSPHIQFWVPAQPLHLPGHQHMVGKTRLIARMKPGVTLPHLQAVLDALAQRLSSDSTLGWRWKRNGAPSGLGMWARPLGEILLDASYSRGADELRRTLLGLLAATGFTLLIVCANVANLMLARTERRQHELAIRTALGAGSARLTRQLLTESALLAGLGGLGGLLATAWGVKLLIALNTIPRLRPVEVDGRVLGIALVVSLLTALAFGFVPAWRGGRTRLNEALAQGPTISTMSRAGRRYRNVLVVVQVALAVVLLTGAGLMVRSVVRLLNVDPGYDPENLVVVLPSAMSEGRRSDSLLGERNRFYEQVREQLKAVPGVTAVGIWKNGAWAEQITPDGHAEPMDVFRGGTGIGEGDYFRVARVPLLSGRYLDQQDVGTDTGAVVVNETMARMCWPGESALGKKFRATDRNGRKPVAEFCEVVGVVGNTLAYRYDEESRPTFFQPFHKSSLTGMPIWMVVRTGIDPAVIMPTLRQELKKVGTEMRTPGLWVARQALYDATQLRRTYRDFLAVFAGVGLLLSALGVYGVLAYSVAQRTREIGIRIAIGAERGDVVALVMGQGARLIAIGVATGLLASFWLTQFLEKQLFQTAPQDSGVLAGVVIVLSAVGLVACWLPARRAAKVDPMMALRAE